MRRWAGKAAAGAAVCAVVAAVLLFTYLRRSLPETSGAVSVAGLSAPVEIIRDADSIPHVFARTVPDALFGLGYVHAQDRLWQMEFQRRIGHGRLAEIFGARALPQDRFLRTVGFGRAARAAWQQMPAWATQQIDAYVAGINAYISAHRGSRLPPEFVLLRIEPEPWSGIDVVVWTKMMAWDLSANYSFELLRDDLVRAVGLERMQELMPPYPDDGITIVRDTEAADITRESGRSSTGARTTDRAAPRPPLSDAESSFAAFSTALAAGLPSVSRVLSGGALTEGLGSNNWVIDGALSATGKPLLANDPHLSTQLPSTWYLAHLSAGDALDVIGATLPGTPAIALGRNRFIAWGATNAYADVEDLYRERLDESGRRAEYRGGSEALTMVSERIEVRGEAPVDLEVRISRHGPLVSDAINAINAGSSGRPGGPARLSPLALRWTALDPGDTTLPAFLKLNQARNWDEFRAALRDFVVPSQNFLYADVDGHIGFYAPGRIPIRARGDGSLPVDGWTGDHEWTGWIPFDELPHLLDPSSHFIVTANNRPMPGSYPYRMGVDWPEPYRASRITELLEGRAALTPDDFARMQSDTVSLHARRLLPLMMADVHVESGVAKQAVELLRTWNGDAHGGSAAAAVFQAWFLRLPRAIVGDELGARLTGAYENRLSFVTRFLQNVLTADDSAWCAEAGTGGRGSCAAKVSETLNDALAELTDRLGSEVPAWRWDRLHRVVFPHQGFDTVPGLGALLGRSSPSAGDWSTVNVGSVSTSRPYEQRAVAGYRTIVDLSSRNDSRFMIDLGQSGHPLSEHYDDFMDDWRNVRYRPMRLERGDIEEGATGRLQLTPRRQ
jgi:penicillin amidase